MKWSFHPRRVGVWHFIVLPTVGMGGAIALSRVVERLAPLTPDSLAYDAYHVLRTVVISLIMASLLTWLAVAYRRQYEATLRARNEALENTRRFLSRIIEGSAEAIVTIDAGQNVVTWNRAAEGIYGWSAEEMIGQKVDRLLPPGAKTQSDKRRVLDQVRAGRTLRDYQVSHVRKDGSRITVRVTLSPFVDPDGRFEGSTAIIRDVSSMVEMERKLREQDRLVAVGKLAAQVAHEIKNPLAGIRGACEVMMGRLAGPREQEIAVEVVHQIDRLNRTVEDLLQFSRPTKTSPVASDLNALIDRVLDLLLEAPSTVTLNVVRDYAADLPSVDVDPEQFQQVMFNVLLNAAQAMDNRGTLTVLTRAANGLCTVTVRDEGPGVPETSLETIFEPFYTTRAKGTGLGLAIVRKIVQAHRGSVEAGAAPGGGAEFRIHLPL